MAVVRSQDCMVSCISPGECRR